VFDRATAWCLFSVVLLLPAVDAFITVKPSHPPCIVFSRQPTTNINVDLLFDASRVLPQAGAAALVFDLDAETATGPAAIDAFLWCSRSLFMAERVQYILTLSSGERPI
jgi:hypothetical protein